MGSWPRRTFTILRTARGSIDPAIPARALSFWVNVDVRSQSADIDSNQAVASAMPGACLLSAACSCAIRSNVSSMRSVPRSRGRQPLPPFPGEGITRNNGYRPPRPGRQLALVAIGLQPDRPAGRVGRRVGRGASRPLVHHRPPARLPATPLRARAPGFLAVLARGDRSAT